MASIHAPLDTETRMNQFIGEKSKTVMLCARTVIKHRNKRLTKNSGTYTFCSIVALTNCWEVYFRVYKVRIHLSTRTLPSYLSIIRSVAQGLELCWYYG